MSKFFLTLFQLTSDGKLQILTQYSFHKFVVQNTFVINDFVVEPVSEVEKNLYKTVTSLGASHDLNSIFSLGTNF